MRILVLNHEFPPVGGGGGEVAKDLSLILAERGHEITVLTALVRGLPKYESAKGLKIIRLPSLRAKLFRANLLEMFVYVMAGIWVGFRIIQQWKPDIIQAHFAVPAGALAWILSRLSGVPYVITSHLGDVPGGVPEKTDGWFRWLYPFTPRIWQDAARVVAVSDFTRKLANRHYPVDIQVIPNGVDLAAFGGGQPVIHNPVQIIFSGRFVPQKNPLMVVEALDGLRDLDWHCTMMGDGALKPEVEHKIVTRGLQARFTLTGWVEPGQVIEQLQRSDILFMPSRTDAFPVTGVYALAAGLAIVASRVSGYVDMVQPGVNGFLYEPDDLEGMRSGLRQLLAQPELCRHAKMHSCQSAERFDIHSVADRYEALFREVLQQKSS